MSEEDSPLSRDDVAEFAGITPQTVSAYLRDGYIPQPDGRMGRSPWWWRSTIESWLSSRPGRGRKQTPSGDTEKE